jgi:hypothetical protein
MAGFKATSLFLLGMLAGLGVAIVVVAHPLDPGRPVAQFGSLNTFLAGILLVTIGLIGSVEIAKGQRTRRLRTALRGIALVAILLALAVGLRRRAERLSGMELQHERQAEQLQRQAEQLLAGRENLLIGDALTPEAAALLRQASWHIGMAHRFRWAASRPWLPVPTPEPYPREEYATSEGSQSGGH